MSIQRHWVGCSSMESGRHEVTHVYYEGADAMRAACIKVIEGNLEHGWYCGLKVPFCNCDVSRTLAVLREVQP